MTDDLPLIAVPDTKWRCEALCLGMGDELFFHLNSSTAVKQAKEICQQCPVAHECLAFAIELRMEYGIWGGMTPSERDELT